MNNKRLSQHDKIALIDSLLVRLKRESYSKGSDRASHNLKQNISIDMKTHKHRNSLFAEKFKYISDDEFDLIDKNSNFSFNKYLKYLRTASLNNNYDNINKIELKYLKKRTKLNKTANVTNRRKVFTSTGSRNNKNLGKIFNTYL